MTQPSAQPGSSRRQTRFPEVGEPPQRLLDHIRESCEASDWPWAEGRSFALVYNLDDAHTQLLCDAYHAAFSANAVSPNAFPSVARMEREVVDMVADLLHAPDAARGVMTSGGSESTLLALKAYRDHARARRPDLTEPRVILPRTAHAAFLKAAHYLDLTPVIVETDAAGRAQLDAIADALDERAVLLIASAPCLPFGTTDPIEQIADLAQQHNIALHVDACLGGFMFPFMADLGLNTPSFDFAVPGVSSITVDLHKYAFAAKGASVTLYRDPERFAHQWFATDQWSSGSFASAHVTGTRPGGAIAAAWAAIHALGRTGYRGMADAVNDAAARLQRGIEAIEGLRIVGEPDMSVFAFTSDRAAVTNIVDRMAARGWRLNRQANPPAIHMILTPRHSEVVNAFLNDLEPAVAEAAAMSNNDADAAPVGVYGLPVAGE
jgi:glutamate/tyrosine decarboxylase-like PLP-dependent enzyme